MTALTHIRTMLFMAVATALASGPGAPVYAQIVKTPESSGVDDAQVPVAPGDTPSQFLIEPEAQIKGDRIKRETYRTQPAGENKNWNLDIGRFQPQTNEDPNQLADDLKENYSGMRLRLPLRGGLGQ